MSEKTLLKSIHTTSTEVWIVFIIITGIATVFHLYIGLEILSGYLVGIFMGILLGIVGSCNIIETKLKVEEKE